jgi:hypothetical protein
MHTSRLGCFTSTGIIAALITALVIAGAAFAQGGVLYSPGALNAQSGEMLGGVTSHAETGGECKVCHVAPWSTEGMADRCAVCHTDNDSQESKPEMRALPSRSSRNGRTADDCYRRGFSPSGIGIFIKRSPVQGREGSICLWRLSRERYRQF